MKRKLLMKGRPFRAGCFTLLFVGLASTLGAQPISIGAEFRVNTSTAGDQQDPQVAMDAAGNFVVVWDDGGTLPLDGSSEGVIAQRYDTDGNPIGSEFVVNTDTLGVQYLGTVAMDSEGNFLVAWIDEGGLGGDSEGDAIAGQLFDSDGIPVGGQLLVNQNTAGLQTRPVIAADSDGEFVIAWTDYPESPPQSLFARRVGGNGQLIGNEFQVNTDPHDFQYLEGLDFDDVGDYVVSWRIADGGSYDVLARRFDSNDLPKGSPFRIPTSSGSHRDSGVVVEGDGSFTVAWFSSGQNRVLARRFDSTGNPTTGELVVAQPSSFEGQTDIAGDAQGNATVLWLDDDGSDTGIFGQQLDSGGNLLGSEFQVNTFTSGYQGYSTYRGPDIAMAPDGRFVVAWQSTDQDGDGYGVYARRYEGNGSGPDPNLIGHWPFDEGSGSTTADTSGNGLDGHLEAGVHWVSGQQATGTSFNGSEALIRVPDSGAGSPIDVVDALTIMAWVLPEGTTGSHQVLVSKDNAYELEFGKLGPATWDLRLNNQIVRTAATSIEEGVWQHLAMTWDGSQVCSYYNGLLDGCSPFAGTLTPNDDDLGFGARPTTSLLGGPVFHFTGSLDEIYVYDRSLDGSEIAALVLDELSDVFPPQRSNLAPSASLPLGTTTAHLTLDTDEAADCRYDTVADRPFALMSQPFDTTGGTSHSTGVAVVDGAIYSFYVRCRDALGNTNGDDVVISFGVDSVDLCLDLAADWRLDEGTGCAAADETGANGAQLGPSCPSNAPAWVPGRNGTNVALDYDGSDDQVRLGTPSGLSSPAVTLAVWFRHGPSGNYRSIVDHRDSGSDGFDLYLDPNSRAFVRINSTTLTGNTVVADDQWHHVAAVYDGSEIRIYVDGQLDSSGPATAGNLDVVAPLFLGRHFANTQFPFAGTLDEVTIHGRALGPIEILDLHNVGVPNCAP